MDIFLGNVYSRRRSLDGSHSFPDPAIFIHCRRFPVIMIEEKMLKCQILKGMFSNERVVSVKLSDGSSTSVFVPSDKVKGGIGTKGSVKVNVFNDEGLPWAVLPTEYKDIVPVNIEDVFAT